MFCRYCGKEIKNDSVWCAYCGKPQNLEINGSKSSNSDRTQNIVETDKAFLGVISCLFLGLIGLIVGVLIYPSGSFRRDTFLTGWFVTFLIVFLIAFIIVFIVLVNATNEPGHKL